MKLIQQLKPKIYINPIAEAEMKNLVKFSDTEIAWHGTVEREGNVFYIEQIFLYPQMVTGATVTAMEKEYEEWLNDFWNKSPEVAKKIRFHGHSHVNMGCFPSGVDLGYRQDISKNLKDFYIFMIRNKKGEMEIQLYDMQHNVIYDKEDMQIEYGILGLADLVDDENLFKEEKEKFIKENKICSTTTNLESSSIQEQLLKKYTSSEQVQLAQALRNCLGDWD